MERKQKNKIKAYEISSEELTKGVYIIKAKDLEDARRKANELIDIQEVTRTWRKK